MGETILGTGFALGPGGKGSNQAVAAARLGADVSFITRLGQDPFADMAMKTWADAGVKPAVIATPESYTGAAYIFIEEGTGSNAIIVAPGAASLISPADIDANAALIRSASVFVTQLEQPLDAAIRALEIAKQAGVTTILNPAPAAALPDSIYRLCDYVTPNETEAEGITGVAVSSVEGARKAADRLLAKGVGSVIITLGEKGALLHTAKASELVPAYRCRPGRRDDRCGRRLQWRAGGRPVARLRARRRRALRLCGGRHFGDAGRHRAIDADACRGDGGIRGLELSLTRRRA